MPGLRLAVGKGIAQRDSPRGRPGPGAAGIRLHEYACFGVPPRRGVVPGQRPRGGRHQSFSFFSCPSPVFSLLLSFPAGACAVRLSARVCLAFGGRPWLCAFSFLTLGPSAWGGLAVGAPTGGLAANPAKAGGTPLGPWLLFCPPRVAELAFNSLTHSLTHSGGFLQNTTRTAPEHAQNTPGTPPRILPQHPRNIPPQPQS